MAGLAELIVSVGVDASQFQSGMARVERSLSSTQSRFSHVGKSISGTGTLMTTGITAPLIGIGTAMVKTGAKFDAQMSRVKAISGATGGQFSQLRKQALELGASTVFSSSQVAEGMENLASAGFTTKEIMKAIPGVLDMAAASGVDLGSAADIAASAIRGFHLKASDAGHVADVLAKSAAVSNADVRGLGEAFKYVAPVAGTMGLSIEEVSAAVGILSDAGIKGEQAGTTLRAGLLRLASPTKEMKKLMEQTGASFFDSNGKMKDMHGIVQTLITATKGMTDEQKANYLATMFGTEAVSGWMALIDAGTGKLDKYTNELKNSDGAASKMAKTMTDNLAGAWENFTGALESLSISFADVLKPALQDVANFLTKLTDKFTDLPQSAKLVIVTIAGIAAAIGPALIVLGAMASGVSALAGAFSFLISPVGLVVAAIALVVAAFVAAYVKIEPFRELVNNTFKAVKDIVVEALTAVASFIQQKLAQIQGFWNANGAQILKAVHNVWDFISPIVQSSMGAVVAVIKSAWGIIKAVISGSLDIIMGLIKVFAGLFTGDLSKMWEGVKQIFSGSLKIIKGVISGAFSAIIGVVSSWASGFKGLISNAWGVVKSLFSSGKNAVVGIVGSLKDSASSIFSKMKNSIVNIAKALWDNVKSVFNSMNSGISSIVNAIKSKVSTVWNSIKSTTSSVFNSVKSTASNIWGGIKSIISSVLGSIKSAVSNAWGNVKSVTSSVFSSVKNYVADKFNSIRSSISNAVTSAKNTVVNIWNSIKSVFSSGVSYVGGKVSGFRSDIVNKFTSIKNSVTGKISEMVSSMKSKFSSGVSGIVSTAKSIPKRVGDGIKKAVSNATSGVKSLANKIINTFKSALGIHSPSKVFEKLGGYVVAGLKNGLSKSDIKSFASNLFGKVTNGALKTWNAIKNAFTGGGSGAVSRWTATATKALMMTGQFSAENLKALLYQMKTESGGNPYAINLWDSNAKKGTPSKGLMQVIEPTFRAYAMKGYDKNIYDPLSNIIASIRYAVARYGSLTKAYRGHGYAKGGILRGTGEGALVRMAENGRSEAIVPIQHKRYMAPFARAVAENLHEPDAGNKTMTIENTVYTTIELDGEVVGRKVEKYVTQQQASRQGRTRRQGGRS